MSAEHPTPRVYLAIPMQPALVTYVLLATIVIVFGLMTADGGSTNPEVLVDYGANDGEAILYDLEVWRFFTSMFIHIGIVHLLVNGYALYILGLEMESVYSPGRYTVIYIVSGLFGSLASFATRGEDVLSAGASGAIFGIIGMNLAYFTMHRKTLGEFGRQRMMSALGIIGINLVIGFTFPGIDNMAHIGGLVAGVALGFGLAPRYAIVDEYSGSPYLVDTVNLANRWWVTAAGVALLALGTVQALAFWGG